MSTLTVLGLASLGSIGAEPPPVAAPRLCSSQERREIFPARRIGDQSLEPVDVLVRHEIGLQRAIRVMVAPSYTLVVVLREEHIEWFGRIEVKAIARLFLLWFVSSVHRCFKIERHGICVLLFAWIYGLAGKAMRSIASASWWPRATSASIAAKVAGELENSVAE